MDWGNATIEFYNSSTKEAMHVLNVLLVGEVNRDRVARFTCARIVHFDKHLPVGSSQHVRFDIRGQAISHAKLDNFRNGIIDVCEKRGISVDIDFLA